MNDEELAAVLAAAASLLAATPAPAAAAAERRWTLAARLGANDIAQARRLRSVGTRWAQSGRLRA